MDAWGETGRAAGDESAWGWWGAALGEGLASEGGMIEVRRDVRGGRVGKAMSGVRCGAVRAEEEGWVRKE